MLLVLERMLPPLRSSERSWQQPLSAAVSTCAPLLAAAVAGFSELGAAGALGGLAFLYLPEQPSPRLALRWLCCAAGLCACFGLGLLAQGAASRLVAIATVGALSSLATAACLMGRVQPPGAVFFVMSVAIGAFGVKGGETPSGLLIAFAAGAAWAGLVAAVFACTALRVSGQQGSFGERNACGSVLPESLAVGIGVTIACLTATWMDLERPFWAAVCCVAVMQGPSLRALWDRQVQRLLGTAAGLMLAWLALLLPLDSFTRAAPMFALTFATEALIVRHYGLAMLFVTPLAILTGEIAAPGHLRPESVVAARLADTAVGGLIGLCAGACLHIRRSRATS